jgi:ABC-type histidine transport system ATPase subunit
MQHVHTNTHTYAHIVSTYTHTHTPVDLSLSCTGCWDGGAKDSLTLLSPAHTDQTQQLYLWKHKTTLKAVADAPTHFAHTLQLRQTRALTGQR